MDWTGPELLKRLDDGAKLGETVYRERGLDHSYSPLQLVRAAKAYRCAGTSGSVLQPGVRAAHTVALSFDDGPSAYTPQVLHLLEHAHVHATFFVSGGQLAGRARILTRMLADGDEIGNALSPGTTTASVAAAHAQLEATVDGDPRRGAALALPRAAPEPEGGRCDPAGRTGPGRAGGAMVPRPARLRHDGPGLIAQHVLSQVRPGSIITLHDGGSNRWATVQAIPQILAGLARRGYRVTTVTTLYRTVLGSPSGARRSAN